MTERRMDPFQDESDVPDPDDGVLPGVDLQLGDEQNLLGNDVIVSGATDDEAQEGEPR